MLIPVEPHVDEIEIKKSRFIAYALPVESDQEARIEIKRLKGENPGAAHVVYAFLVGLEKSQGAGLSDDGEPHGTAGRPVMEVLKGSGVTNLLIGVVRYFGGTKLGTGGLVKAYTESAQRVLQGLITEEWIPRKEIRIHFDYTFHGGIKQILPDFDLQTTAEEFGTEVSLSLKVALEQVDSLEERLVDFTKGSVRIETL